MEVTDIETPQENKVEYRRQESIPSESPTNDIQPLIDSHIKHHLLKPFFEFIGTFVFIFISIATVNATVLSSMINKTSVSQLTISIGFTAGLTVGVHLSSSISGAHLNPAISFTMALCRKITWKELLFYTIAQVSGAFMASLLVFTIYYNSIQLYGYNEVTAGMFGTLKLESTSIGLGLLEQIIGTALLMIGILVVIKINPERPNSFLIGLVLGVLGLCLGNNGFAFNMARDLGPRMMSAMFWGRSVFSYQNHWWWVPIVGSYIGAPLGFILFTLMDDLSDN